jgi:hypothetical protein
VQLARLLWFSAFWLFARITRSRRSSPDPANTAVATMNVDPRPSPGTIHEEDWVTRFAGQLRESLRAWWSQPDPDVVLLGELPCFVT